MRLIALLGALLGVVAGIFVAIRMCDNKTNVKLDVEERVLIERARGHITSAQATAIRDGVRLVLARDRGIVAPTTTGTAPPFSVGTYFDKSGGRDLIIDGPTPATVVADGPCTLTSLDRWIRPQLTVAHCSQAGFESIVELTDLAGVKRIIAMTTHGSG